MSRKTNTAHRLSRCRAPLRLERRLTINRRSLNCSSKLSWITPKFSTTPVCKLRKRFSVDWCCWFKIPCCSWTLASWASDRLRSSLKNASCLLITSLKNDSCLLINSSRKASILSFTLSWCTTLWWSSGNVSVSSSSSSSSSTGSWKLNGVCLPLGGKSSLRSLVQLALSQSFIWVSDQRWTLFKRSRSPPVEQKS